MFETHEGNAVDLRQALAKGTIGAVATPMGARGAVDAEVVGDYASALDGALDGVCVWAHTGRGLHLNESDRSLVIDAFRTKFHGPVVAAVGPQGRMASDVSFDDQLEATLAMARQAAAHGADGLMVYPMSSLQDQATKREHTLRLHESVCAATDLPVIGFYLYGAAGGVEYDTDLLEELCRQSGVIGVKLALLSDAIGCQDAIAAIHRGGGLAITGEDRMLGPSLMWGADAALVGLGAAAAPITTSVVSAWFRDDAEGFLRASERLDEFATVVFRDPMDGYVQRMLWVAEAEGIVPAEAAVDRYGPPLDGREKAETLAAYSRAMQAI